MKKHFLFHPLFSIFFLALVGAHFVSPPDAHARSGEPLPEALRAETKQGASKSSQPPQPPVALILSARGDALCRHPSGSGRIALPISDPLVLGSQCLLSPGAHLSLYHPASNRFFSFSGPGLLQVSERSIEANPESASRLISVSLPRGAQLELSRIPELFEIARANRPATRQANNPPPSPKTLADTLALAQEIETAAPGELLSFYFSWSSFLRQNRFAELASLSEKTAQSHPRNHEISPLLRFAREHQAQKRP